MITMCPNCFTPFQFSGECPLCRGDQRFADGYLACWNEHVQRKEREVVVPEGAKVLKGDFKKVVIEF